VEAIIPEALKRLRTTGEVVVRLFEETEEEDSKRIVRRQVVEWVRLGVSILTEQLDRGEKITALSKVMEEIMNETHAPQEI